MKAGLCTMLLMETTICDCKHSQLLFSTTRAHSTNAQPSSKEKKASLYEAQKGQSPEKPSGP